MMALDSSSVIAYLSGDQGNDVEQVEFALEQKQGVFPPVVLCELLSAPKILPTVVSLLKGIPLLELVNGYWERVGLLRSRLISSGFKARLADSLIAQSCIDHRTPLITRDTDFKHFVRLGGLRLL